MYCMTFEKKIFAAIENQKIDQELKQHLEKCSDCRALYEELCQQNEYLLDAGASFTLPDQLEERIISSLPQPAPISSRIPYRWFAYAVAACVLILLTFLLYPNAHVAKVAKVDGRFQVKTLTGWKDLEEGGFIRDKAVLRTLDDSEAKIVFKEGNYIRFEPESSIYLGARVHKQHEHIYRLEYGSIWARVSHNYHGEFYIETPNALIIRVLGTEFNVRSTETIEQEEE